MPYTTELHLLDGNYSIIAADPPWNYQDKAAAGKRGASFKYPCMSIDDLCSMPIASLAADDCCLFLWTTGPMLVDGTAEKLTRAWGFTPKTMAFTWVKTTRLNKEWFWGMGRWTRANPEYMTLATRGKPKRLSAAVHSVIKAPIMEHSQKPAEYRARIVKLLGDISRVELFARGDLNDGWDRWGNEASGPRELIPKQ